MILKTLLPFIFLSVISFCAESQQLKVKRKGITPLDVTKKTLSNVPAYSLSQFAGRWQERSEERRVGKECRLTC